VIRCIDCNCDTNSPVSIDRGRYICPGCATKRIASIYQTSLDWIGHYHREWDRAEAMTREVEQMAPVAWRDSCEGAGG